ncbi:VOC family protein [Teredinibacter haidensis]|uniref:VOC family protein n=1 Tax=Teredinibacter haidensis TaxID=2731755 RepID=UPI0009F96F00|nr:VOC family protein [Teredinibacter haidensis]
MGIKFINTIVFCSDIKLSKNFYESILGVQVEKDLGDIVFFGNNLVLHCADSITSTVFKREKSAPPSMQGKKNILIYFEVENLEQIFSKIGKIVKVIHGVEKQAWGQKVFRFYDPDGHIIEFGEPFDVNS